MTCVHRTYPTEERAVSKWYHMGKARRDKFTVYQCPKCQRWRVISDALAAALPTIAQVVREKQEEREARIRNAERRQKYNSPESITKRQCPFCYAFPEHWRECPAYLATGKRCRLREPKSPKPLPALPRAEEAQEKRQNENRQAMSLIGTRKRKFAPRPKRAGIALARAIALQLTPEWAITAEQREGWHMLWAVHQAGGKPTRGQVYLATRKLGPFNKLPKWLQLALLSIGVILPRTEHGRIPLGEALTWAMKRTDTEVKQGKKPVTFYDALVGYSLTHYGSKNGKDYAQSTAAWVLEYAGRDLRRSEHHFGIGGVTDRRKPHRVRKASKPNRWRKFSTRSLKHYWSWLVALLKKCAKHQGNLPENLVVLPYDDGRPAEYDSSIRHTRKTPAALEN